MRGPVQVATPPIGPSVVKSQSSKRGEIDDFDFRFHRAWVNRLTWPSVRGLQSRHSPPSSICFKGHTSGRPTYAHLAAVTRFCCAPATDKTATLPQFVHFSARSHELTLRW